MGEKPVQNDFLMIRSASRICAVPLSNVVETMRPLPARRFAGSPEFVPGVSIIRGSPTVVVDLGRLLGEPGVSAPRRFVTLRLGDRRIALAVDDVLGVQALMDTERQELPPLLANSDARLVQSIGALDSEFLVFLQATRILPDETWQALVEREATPCP